MHACISTVASEILGVLFFCWHCPSLSTPLFFLFFFFSVQAPASEQPWAPARSLNPIHQRNRGSGKIQALQRHRSRLCILPKATWTIYATHCQAQQANGRPPVQQHCHSLILQIYKGMPAVPRFHYIHNVWNPRRTTITKYVILYQC